MRVRIDSREHLVDIEYQVRGSDSPTREPLTTLTGATHQPEHWVAIRRFTNEHRKQSRPGVGWVEASGQLTEYESRLESAALLLLEFEGGVFAVTPQPFRLHFQQSRKPANHVPDFFIRYTDGTGAVINVKPTNVVDKPNVQKQFAATERACTQAGWGHRVITTLTDTVQSNLMLLAGYRRAPLYTDVVLPAVFDRLADGAPQPLHPLADATARDIDLPRALVLPALFHAMWHHEVRFPLNDTLTAHTPITLEKESR